jgi:DUF4097 and DUF4098 domain-containing protein YvlB
MKLNSKIGCRSIILISALVVSIAAAEAQAETGSFERSYEVDEPIQLEVKTDSGSIEIRSGRSGHAEVIGHAEPTRRFLRRSTKEAEELVRRFEANPPVEFTGGRLLVGRNLDKEFSRHLVISYEIVVPATTQVKSRTDSGSQSISGISGPVEASADSGDVTVADIDGPVEASADSGDVTLADIDGPVEASADSGDVKLTNIGDSAKARTDSGSISADGIAGAFEARTDSGDVRLIQAAPGDVIVSTDSGSSDLRGIVGALRVNSDSGDVVVEGRQEGAWSLETDSGSVRISLPADAAFKLDARSISSGIYIDHPVTLQGRISENRLTGDVRGGGSLLQIRTDSGDIRIE